MFLELLDIVRKLENEEELVIELLKIFAIVEVYAKLELSEYLIMLNRELKDSNKLVRKIERLATEYTEELRALQSFSPIYVYVSECGD